MGRLLVQTTLLGILLAVVAQPPKQKDWDIYSFHINSTVTSRYATTIVTSRVVNRIDAPKEVEFQVRIPKNAFITRFRMLIDGQMYDGVVKAKEEAQQQYADAVSHGQSAGMVSSVGRTLEEFKTSVTVAALQKVTFELTYEELLKRRLGKYELQIHARPMQPVKDFKVDVYISEKAGIQFLEVKGGLSTNVLANAITKTLSHSQAWVHFYPTEDQQKTCENCGEQGMNGDLVIVYDVNRHSSLGDIKESERYFVHHFAPAHLPRIPKNVVFVIDRSGSMHGRKIQQTRLALLHILGDLAEEDYFGLIIFDRIISPWKRELLQATQENLDAAKAFVKTITDGGATDINSAVLQGASMLKANPRAGSASLLLLLTDGDPTSGVTNIEEIQSNVRKAIGKKFPLYCLGFGFDVNFEFLEKMALENQGVARRIYEDSDADLQLKGFYEEVATPLLTDVEMIYPGGTNLTQTNFSQYYNGSEIVVAGQITDNNIQTFIPQVVAISRNSKVNFSDKNVTVDWTETTAGSQIQKIWAYLTVKQLLEKELQLSGAEKDRVKSEALELSLKYSFVTPLTSMVVTKPQGESTQVLHKPKEGEKLQSSVAYGRVSKGAPPPGVHHGYAMGYGGGVGGAGAAGQGMYPAPPPGVHHGYAMGYGGGVGGAGAAGQGMYPGVAPPPVVFDGYAMGYGGHVRGGGQGIFPAPPPVVHRGNAMSYGGGVVTAGIHPAPPPVIHHGYAMGNGGGVRGAGGILPGAAPPVVHHGYAMGYAGGVTSTGIKADILPGPLVKFILRSENIQILPLCYEFSAAILQLLHHPTRELSMNGQLGPSGFQRIVLHYKSDHRIDMDTKSITVKDGENVTTYNWRQDLILPGSVTLILRNKEVDIAVGDTRLVVVLHERQEDQFLWPILRQIPSGDNIDGILALKPVLYEEYQRPPAPPAIRIKDRIIDAARSSVMDYSIQPASGQTMDCWLISLESVLERHVSEFVVLQL